MALANIFSIFRNYLFILYNFIFQKKNLKIKKMKVFKI